MVRVDCGQLVLENLIDLGPEEACLKAVADILGVPHHVYFIEVKNRPEADEAMIQIAVNDPYDRLGDVERLNEGMLQTVNVPGYDGNYVMVVFPFAD